MSNSTGTTIGPNGFALPFQQFVRPMPYWGTSKPSAEQGDSDWVLTLGSNSWCYSDLPTAQEPSKDEPVSVRYDYCIWVIAQCSLTAPPPEYQNKIASHTVVVTPCVEGSFRTSYVSAGDQAQDLTITSEQVTPPTTQVSTSCTTTSSETLSANAGFFGDSITAGFSASYTVSHSTTTQIPAVLIKNNAARRMVSWELDFSDSSSLSATNSYSFSVQAVFRIQGYSPMYLAYCDFMTRAPRFPPPNDAGTLEDDTATNVPLISPADRTTWRTGSADDKYALLQKRAGQITDAFNFSCRVDLKATTTSGLDLPVPSTWIKLYTPPVLNSGSKASWLKYIETPPSIRPQLNPPIGKSSVIVGCLIYDTTFYPTSNLQTSVQTGNGLALCSRMFDYQTLISWDGAYKMNIMRGTGQMVISVAAGANQGSIVWSGPIGGTSAYTIPAVLTIDDNNITAATATGQTLYQINQPTTPRIAGISTAQAQADLAALQSEPSSNNYWSPRIFPMPAEPPGIHAPNYRLLTLTTSGTLNYVDYNGQILWSSKPSSDTAEQLAAAVKEATAWVRPGPPTIPVGFGGRQPRLTQIRNGSITGSAVSYR